MYRFTCYSQLIPRSLPPLCPHDMGHILRTKILDKPMVCVNRRLQSWTSQRNVGHMASKEKGEGMGQAGMAVGEEGMTSREVCTVLSFRLCRDERFYFLLEKQSFKNQQANGRRKQRLSPYPQNHIQTTMRLYEARWERLWVTSLCPLWHVLKSSFPRGETLATTTGCLFPKIFEAWKRLFCITGLSQFSPINCLFLSLFLLSPWL